MSSAGTEGEKFWHQTVLLRMVIQTFLVDRIWGAFLFVLLYYICRSLMLLQNQKCSFDIFLLSCNKKHSAPVYAVFCVPFSILVCISYGLA